MPPIGDKPLGASMEATRPAARRASRRERHRFVAHYPAVEETTMTAASRTWGPGRTAGFIVASAALAWAAVFGVVALLH